MPFRTCSAWKLHRVKICQLDSGLLHRRDKSSLADSRIVFALQWTYVQKLIFSKFSHTFFDFFHVFFSETKLYDFGHAILLSCAEFPFIHPVVDALHESDPKESNGIKYLVGYTFMWFWMYVYGRRYACNMDHFRIVFCVQCFKLWSFFVVSFRGVY